MVIPKKNIIIFFIPYDEIVNGGVMSIFSIARESRRFRKIHESDVVICTFPGYPTYKKNSLFQNDERIYSFDEIIEEFPVVNSLQVQIPELGIDKLLKGYDRYYDYFNQAKKVSINVLNQNIMYMPEPDRFAELYQITTDITQTTAHNRYANQVQSNKYATPLKHLSVFIDPSQYESVKYEDKENLIAYSNDQQPLKSSIVTKLASELSDYKLVEINGLTYKEYKSLISRAKFVITFGEGFDGYFIEGAFAGAIPLAVYNDDFFPSPSYRSYKNLYDSYDEMLKSAPTDVRKFDERNYTDLNKKLVSDLSKLYGFKTYLRNLELFYKRVFDFMPSAESILELKSLAIRSQVSLNRKLKIEIKALQGEIIGLNQRLDRVSDDLSTIRHSKSWKLIESVRRIKIMINRLTGR